MKIDALAQNLICSHVDCPHYFQQRPQIHESEEYGLISLGALLMCASNFLQLQEIVPLRQLGENPVWQIAIHLKHSCA